MFYYVPRMWHAAALLLFCVLMIALCGWRGARGWVLVAFLFGAFMFALMSAAVLWMLLVQAYDERLDRMIELAKLYSNMDPEARQAFAFQFPSMQYRMKRGEVRAYFEDTNVPIETFRLFLQASNDRYISPRRDWYTTEKPEWAWVEIKNWLEGHDRIIADSAAGSHSWLWRGNSYQHLFAYWMAGRKLADLSDRVYTYDTTSSPLKETSSQD